MSSQIKPRRKMPVAVFASAIAVSLFAASGTLTAGFQSLTNKIADSITNPSSPKTKAQVTRQMSNLPLSFIENQGQMDKKVSHYLQGAGTSVFFTSEGLVFALKDKVNPDSQHALELGFVGANQVIPTSVNKTAATVSYFTGAQDQWKTGLQTSSGLKYTNLWPGIDLVYSGTGQKLKYDFHVAPGADPSQIKLAYKGATALNVNEEGQLQIETPASEVIDDRPFSYQEVNGARTKVESSYALTEGSVSYGFSLGDYDRTKPLVIDPAVLVYAGFIGGTGIDNGQDIKVDATGAAYVVGWAASTQASFPDGDGFGAVPGADLTHAGSNDVFIAKINPGGTALVYASYIGGSTDERAFGVAVDATGAAYIAGRAQSTELTGFPVLVGPDLTHNGAFFDSFISKLNPAGTALVYSGFIGGDGFEQDMTIEVDASGAAYVGGSTLSGEGTFPVWKGPFLVSDATGVNNGYVAKVAPDGTHLIYCGFLPSSNLEILDIAVDSTGALYAVGSTAGFGMQGFDPKVGPDLTFNGGQTDGFIVKVKPNGTGIVYAGYIGGSEKLDPPNQRRNDKATSVVVDSSGAAYVMGQIPLDPGDATFPDGDGIGALSTFDASNNGGFDTYAVKVQPDGTGFLYAGFIGGSADEGQTNAPAGTLGGIDVDASGAAYVSNLTASTSATFPDGDGIGVLDTFDGTENGSNDVFVAKIQPSGTGLAYAGFLGGAGAEIPGRVAVDAAGNVYVTGVAGGPSAATFPDGDGFGALTTFDGTHNSPGTNDAFVAKIS